jgi:hypothetical protein
MVLLPRGHTPVQINMISPAAFWENRLSICWHIGIKIFSTIIKEGS